MKGHQPSVVSAEVVVLIKAAPQVGQRHGETVSCAGLDMYGQWLRLYLVSFRQLDPSKKFGRWDSIRFDARPAKDDPRMESRRIIQESIEIVGKLKPAERGRFLSRSIVTSLQREREAGRSLALLKPEVISFIIEKKSEAAFNDEARRFAAIHARGDPFSKQVTPYRVCPFQFRYQYRTDDGERLSTCQDWELEATFYNWSRQYGETKALERMCQVFGEEYPAKGMLLAIGTHSLYPDTWLINGVIGLDPIKQTSLL